MRATLQINDVAFWLAIVDRVPGVRSYLAKTPLQDIIGKNAREIKKPTKCRK